MKYSIVISVLNSHEIVRRQLLHFRSMRLPADTEIILMDDGSKPPIRCDFHVPNLTIHATNDFRPWTQPLARNEGARLAKGKYLVCTDIDHILTRRLLNKVYEFKGDVMHFMRQVAVLDELGNLTQKTDVLASYGFPMERIKKRAFRTSPHSNSYAIKRDLFLRLGGSRYTGVYPNRDEIPLKRQLKRLAARGEITIVDGPDRPVIYTIPNGRFCGDVDSNPFNLFHNLSRKKGAK